MSKLIKASIDVSKIKKEGIFEGKTGKWVSIDIWVNDEPDQYGNIAGIKQSLKVGDKFESHYIGNGKYPEVKQQQPTPVEAEVIPPKIDDLQF